MEKFPHLLQERERERDGIDRGAPFNSVMWGSDVVREPPEVEETDLQLDADEPGLCCLLQQGCSAGAGAWRPTTPPRGCPARIVSSETWNPLDAFKKNGHHQV